MGFVKRYLMGKNVFKFTQNISTFLIFNVVDNIYVGHNPLVLIIINWTYELSVTWILW